MTSEQQLFRAAQTWRMTLAERLVGKNPGIGDGELNRYVQRSLLDSVFLGICSQRGLPGGAELLHLLDDHGDRASGLSLADLPTPPPTGQPTDLPDDVLGHLHERNLARPLKRTGGQAVTTCGRSARRGQGVYFTPHFIVDHILHNTLGPLCDRAVLSPALLKAKPKSGDSSCATPDTSVSIVDPACGAGVFLVRSFEYLAKQYAARQPLDLADRVAIAGRHLFGVDRDPQAVHAARLSLALRILGTDEPPSNSPTLVAETLQRNIRCGDALVGPEFIGQRNGAGSEAPSRTFDWPAAFPTVFQRQPSGFDAVVGNPPYVNIRHITQQLGERAKRYFQARYRCARGSYDLYVLFMERAFELLRAGGRFGMIVPNKLATLGYAEECRRLLLSQTVIEQIVDVADMAVFRDAGVYPFILSWRKETPSATRHSIRVVEPAAADVDLGGPLPGRQVRQSSLSAERGFALSGDLDLESRLPTVPLSDLAELHSGATGFTAAELASALIESSEVGGDDHFEFIVSGNIDRYRVDFGDVRFMKRKFLRPRLAVDAACLSERKRSLFREPKIVIAGMTRRLEAAYDPGGTALGVQVYAIRRPSVDARYLLAVLNSRLISQLFRQRFAAKRLAGGYLAINKRQLAQLPIRQLDLSHAEQRHAHDQLTGLVDRMLRLQGFRLAGAADDNDSRNTPIEQIDRQIDALVERLYDVGAHEMAA